MFVRISFVLNYYNKVFYYKDIFGITSLARSSL